MTVVAMPEEMHTNQSINQSISLVHLLSLQNQTFLLVFQSLRSQGLELIPVQRDRVIATVVAQQRIVCF